MKSDKKKNLINSAKRILKERREKEASKQATQKTLILSEKHTKQHKTQSCRSEEDELHAEESDDEMLLRMNKDTVQSCDEMLEWMDEVCIP
jgi:LAS superfamily LD-carboxypeptidase LdcB